MATKERRAAPRKPETKPAAKAAPAPTTRASGAKSATTKPLSNEDLYNLIAETAYFKAKARGFAPGGEVQDWIEAEAEVRDRMRAGAP